MQVNVHNIERTALVGFPQNEPDSKPFVALYLHDGDAYISLLLDGVGEFDRLTEGATAARARLIELQLEHYATLPPDEVNVCDVCEESIYNNGDGWQHQPGTHADHEAVPSNAVVEMPVA